MTRLMDALEKVIEAACVVALAVVVGAVSWQVLARYVTQASTAWAPELAQIAFVWLAMLAIPLGVRRRKHLVIDVWTGVRNRTFQAAVLTAATAIIVVVSLVLAYAGWNVLDVAMRRTLPGLGVPSGWMNAAVPVGFALCAVFALEVWWRALRAGQLTAPSATERIV
jgi:TRAP-type transport system small permease protein